MKVGAGAPCARERDRRSLVHTGQHYDAGDVRRLPRGARAAGAGRLPRCRLRDARRADRARARRRRARAARAPTCARRRRRRRQLDARRRARRGEDRVPVAHIESGLRSFDPTMPEEHNRQLTDHMSDAAARPLAERGRQSRSTKESTGDAIELVGNTMIDSLLAHVEARKRGAALAERSALEPGELRARDAAPSGTRRRPAAARRRRSTRSTSSPRDIPLVFPVHPRTRDARSDEIDACEGVILTPPARLPRLPRAAGVRAVRRSPTPAASRRRRRRSAFRASPCATRPSAR